MAGGGAHVQALNERSRHGRQATAFARARCAQWVPIAPVAPRCARCPRCLLPAPADSAGLLRGIRAAAKV